MGSIQVNETVLQRIVEDAVAKAIDEKKIEAAVTKAVNRAFFDVGLRVDEQDHIEEGRKDFTFVRRLRTAIDAASSTVGKTVLTGLVVALLGVVWLGVQLAVTKTGAPR